MDMPPEVAERVAAQLARMQRARAHNLVARAWHSICAERGYVNDLFLSTASHGTIALRSVYGANGV